MDLFAFALMLSAPVRSSAARAALDLKGNKSLRPYPSQKHLNPAPSTPTNNEIDFSYS